MFRLIDGGKKDAPESKRELFGRLSETGPVLVTLHTDRAIIPPHLKASPLLTLAFSPRFHTRLFVSDDGLDQILDFGHRGEFRCVVPWSAIINIRAQ